jgi:ssRNA-specific RNase YbeY (16S rRNA maturation enzyme)
MPPETEGVTGEVVLNVQRAAAEGRRRQGASRELARYLAHGLQHLTGATDATAGERTRMHRRERAWLRAAEAQDLLDDLMEGSENTQSP